MEMTCFFAFNIIMTCLLFLYIRTFTAIYFSPIGAEYNTIPCTYNLTPVVWPERQVWS